MFVTTLLIVNLLCADPPTVRAPEPSRVSAGKVVTPASNHVPDSDPLAVIGEVDSILNRWERAAMLHEMPSQRESVRLHVSRGLNGHAAIAAEKLVGVLDLKQLKEHFQWRLVEPFGDQVCLEAVPRDETEQLFYGAIRVRLNISSWRLEMLQITNRQDVVCAEWLAPPNISAIDGIVQVMLDDGVPPSPKKADGDIPSLMPKPSRQTDAPPMTREVAEILEKWESTSREIKTARLQFVRTVYNPVFQKETVAEGELLYQTPDKISLVVRPLAIGANAKSRRRGKDGHLFRLLPDQAETWIWNSNQLLRINEIGRTYDRIELPVKEDTLLAFLAHAQSHVPFLLDGQIERLRKYYSVEVQMRMKDRILLVAKPKAGALGENLRECLILIDEKLWQTSAVRIIDAANVETVFKVTSRKINTVLPSNSFDPDLKALGYKLLSPSEAE